MVERVSTADRFGIDLGAIEDWGSIRVVKGRSIFGRSDFIEDQFENGVDRDSIDDQFGFDRRLSRIGLGSIVGRTDPFTIDLGPSSRIG